MSNSRRATTGAVAIAMVSSFTLLDAGELPSAAQAYGGSGKSGYQEYIPLSPEYPRDRIGVIGTGTFGIDAQFLSDAFVKKKPKMPVSDITSSEEDDFAGGVEIFYERVLSDPGQPHLWGLRAAAGYTNVEIEDKASSVDEFGGLITAGHDLDADIFHVSFGPFYEYRFTERFYAQFGAGLTAAYINADYRTSESSGGTRSSTSENDVLFGAYASAALGFDVTPGWGILGGIRYQYLDSFDLSNSNGSASLDFDNSYVLFVGARWTF